MHHFSERGLFIDVELIELELDALLVVVTRKAPHDVLRRRLLHVLLKVIEGFLSHEHKVRACGLVAHHEVRHFLRVPLHQMMRVLPFSP